MNPTPQTERETINQQLKDGLLAAHTALVEKIGKQPYLPFILVLDNNGSWAVSGAYLDDKLRERFSGPYTETPEAAIAGVMEAIRKMPSENERNLHEFQKKVAEIIDFGNAKGIEAQWMNPIVEMSRNLATNAITQVPA